MNDEQYRTLLKGMEELHEVAQNTLTGVDALSLDIQDLSERLAGRQNDCPTPPPWVGSTAITGLSDDLEDDQDDNLHLMAGGTASETR